jgi:hypothetical protein
VKKGRTPKRILKNLGKFTNTLKVAILKSHEDGYEGGAGLG